MADEYVDPSGTSEVFRAFVPAPELATQAGHPVREPSRLPLPVAVVMAAVMLAMAFWIALS
ncbi:hypothetical protein GA0074692_6240 [Micromonospora pallida]|uniref:Uncharacterized protein n=1 Tax=Micromonospora pallida TaxID=145854 RepID=A0A1C6THQ3_9ACTN|nr:hypothetical protein [Micromonospora pallida]SCL41288.1 hypothetical protein GA0074692_6240 [Micromonospora pallida]